MKSLTIIQNTRPGLLAEITTLLESNGIDLRSIDGNTVGTLAVISLTAEPYRDSLSVLADAGFKVFVNEQILVHCPDKPGALAEISRRLANVQVDIRSIHFINRETDHCIVALETDNDYAARKVLKDLLV
ncbi:MAG TPA: ACT domain-containing protein [Xanthomonadales bacterium]|nr:ACT domain-containing protein [Xanthomonadales bacterium]